MSDDEEFDPRPGAYASGVGDTSGSRNLERRRKKEAAREKLEQIQDMEDPVERIKELAVFFRRGPGEHLTSEPDMEKLLDKAQSKTFKEIRAIAEEEDDPQSYLSDVLFETDPDLVDDYKAWTGTTHGLVKTVHRRVEKLVDKYPTNAEEDEALKPSDDSPEKRFRFQGPRNALRYLLNEMFERWIDDAGTNKREFFNTVAPIFETDSGAVRRKEATDMAKKVGGRYPADASAIDDLLNDVAGDEEK